MPKHLYLNFYTNNPQHTLKGRKKNVDDLQAIKKKLFYGETHELCKIENTHTKHNTKLRQSLV
jgi:hypothetical protein